MPNSIYQNIRTNLEHFLSNIKDIPETIYHENLPFQATDEHIITKLVPTSRKPSHVGRDPVMRYQGLLKVYVCVNKDTGPANVEFYADEILKTMDATTDLDYEGFIVTIMNSERTGGYLEDNWYKIRIDLDWYTYA